MYHHFSVIGTYQNGLNSFGLVDVTSLNPVSRPHELKSRNSSDHPICAGLPVGHHCDLNKLHTMNADLTNSTTIPDAPVWLEQGDYFFDDEFSVPYSAQLQPIQPVGHSANELGTPAMTRSLVTELCSSETATHLVSGPSHSASFFSTPADSCESDVATGQTYNNTSGHLIGVAADNECMNRNSQFFTAVVTQQITPPVASDINDALRSQTLTTRKNGSHAVNTNQENIDGSSQQSVLSGSIGSCETESNSWMQMMMERSCNPELKALLGRTAAAAEDYKLTFGDNILNDFSSLSDWPQRFNDAVVASSAGFGRSLSQGNMFDLNSFSGLRRALQQANTSISDKKSIRTCEDISEDFKEIDVSSSPQSKDDNIDTKTTTWAQKHGSRESLKRRSLKISNNEQTHQETASSDDRPPCSFSTNWHAIRQANGRLVTWNQLKRSANSARESRPREQAARWPAESENTHEGLVEKQYCSDGGGSHNIRSRSQPVSHDNRGYRFSGTLLEIFMRARTDDAFASIARCDMTSSDNHTGFKTLNPTITVPNTAAHGTSTVRVGLRNVPTAMKDHGRRSLESDKHPLLRGDRILPQRLHPTQFSPMSTSMIDSPRFMRNCGTQVPSVGPITEPAVAYQTNAALSLAWSNGTSTCQANVIPKSTRNAYKYSSPNLRIAPCLTASAGPDSQHFAALRATYLTEGYAAGWLGNPRASIAYPGLGLLSIPRPSRLAASAFLSNTLPDLSFLGQAAAEEERKGTPTMPKRSGNTGIPVRSSTDESDGCCCRKCGCRSASANQAVSKCRRTIGTKRQISMHQKPVAPSKASNNMTKEVLQSPSVAGRFPQVPDLVAGHVNISPFHSKLQKKNIFFENTNRLYSGYNPMESTNGSAIATCPLERSTSDPGVVTSNNNLGRRSHRRFGRRSRFKAPLAVEEDGQTSLMPMFASTSTGGAESTKASVGGSLHFSDGDDDEYQTDQEVAQCGANGPKKSVSFNGKVHLLHLQSNTKSPNSPEPKAIPRSWGLYGQATPVAEFNTRASPGRDVRSNSDVSRPSDVDLRYHAMVNEVIKAVQETIAYFSTADISKNKQKTSPTSTTAGSTTQSPPASPRPSSLPLPYTAIAALGSGGTVGRQALLAVVAPLTVLLCDGLLPPGKPIFVSKPRTKLWQMVEESCRPNSALAGVALHVLTDALQQVKSLANIVLEKVKLKAFICACLNSKALPMWLNALVSNDHLLRRFYCQDAFIRQCRSSQRGLHADLMTHIEQLLTFPFNIDVAAEARRPLGDVHVTPSATTTPCATSVGQMTTAPVNTMNCKPINAAVATVPSTTTKVAKTISTKSNIPPATAVPRRQAFTNTASSSGGPTRITPVPTSTTNPIPHYPPHHLPGQRALSSQQASTARGFTPNRSFSGRPPTLQQPQTVESSEGNSVTSSALSSDAKQRRSPVVTTTSSMRGRFKTSLFRRGAGSTQPTTGGASTSVPDASSSNVTTTSKRLESELPPQSTTGKRLSNPTGMASKLKQPSSTTVGPR